MAGIGFSIHDDDIDKLITQIQAFQGNAEEAIGDYLENTLPGIAKPSIQNLIPVSDRNKPHAKYSRPFTEDMDGRLSISIHTTKKWHYLYFPDEGEGTSKGQAPHNFMEEGIEKEYDTIINGILDSLINEWQ